MLAAMKSKYLFLTAAVAFSAAPDAGAETRPKGTYVLQTAEEARGARPGAIHGGTQRILFVNRHGGFYTRGPNDASNNVSSIVPISGATVPAFDLPGDAWDRLMACVRAQYERFDIIVTDEDPGDVPHEEAVVGGSPQDIGQPAGVGGVSPFTFDCNEIPNAINFTFSEVYGTNVQAMCETVAQESAHSYGLDHELYCPDPMTYLVGCGPKKFVDFDAPCGEDVPRECVCGGTRQNSVDRLNIILGKSDPVPPTLTIVSPTEGEEVPPGFPIVVDAMDDKRITKGELIIDGMDEGLTGDGEEVAFNAPLDISFGPHTIEVRIHDVSDNIVSQTVNVVVAPECETAADCPDGEDCGGGRCAAGLGTVCANHAECASALCGISPDGARGCTQQCGNDDACPAGYECAASATCWPAEGGGGGCQASTGRTTAAGAALALLVLGMFVTRRKRS